VNVTMRRRDFQDMLAPPRVTLTPLRYGWDAIGGPMTAEVRATGPRDARWELVAYLRCPIEIHNTKGEPVWWGYVAEVEVTDGAITARVDLDELANRVAVAYAYVSAANTIGERATTAWAENGLSVAEYGTFERLDSSANSNPSAADEQRDQILEQYAYPVAAYQINPGGRGESATLHCRGWFTTLSRRHWEQGATGEVGNVEQIAEIVDEVSEFLIGTDITALGAIVETDIEQYRDGDTNAQAEIEQLLAVGSNGRRLLAEVTRERWLRLIEEPAPGVRDYLLRSDGTLRDYLDAPLPEGACPVGVWARLVDVVPATVNTSVLADPSMVMIERLEWDCRRNRFGVIEPRGPSAMAVSRLDRV
jgi:hypothetical protein